MNTRTQIQTVERFQRSRYPSRPVMAPTISRLYSLEELGLILDRFPDNIDARLKRGRLLEDVGQFDEATRDYAYVLTLYPANISAKRGLRRIFNQPSREFAEESYLTPINPALDELD